MAHYPPQPYQSYQNQRDCNYNVRPQSRTEPTYIPNRVFVGGLPPNTTEAELTQFFSQYVNVVDCKVVLNPDRAGRNFGFISVDSEADADLLKDLDERKLFFKDRKLNVASAMKKQFRNDYADANSSYVAPSMNNSYSYMPMIPQQQQQYFYNHQNNHYMNSSIPYSPAGDEPNAYNYYKNAHYAMVGQPCYDVNQNQYYPAHGYSGMNEHDVYSQYYQYAQHGYQMPRHNYSYDMNASYYPAPVERPVTPVSSPLVKTSSRSSGSPSVSTPRDDKQRTPRLSGVYDTPKTGKGSGPTKAKKSISPELPIKLEPRKKGPDGRFRKADPGSQHYKFIRSPPSATKSLPDRPKPAGRVIMSLVDKFNSMNIEKQDHCCA